MRGGAFAWPVLFVAACQSQALPPALGDTSEDASTRDAGDGGELPTVDGGIDIPASSGLWSADAGVMLQGAGTGELGAIDVAHGVGTISFAGAQASAFYLAGSSVPLADAGADSDLAQERDLEILAVQPGRIVLVWVTCSGSDLAYIYYETTDGEVSNASMPASGTCDVVDEPTTESVTLPAIEMPPPTVVSGFAISGSQLSFDGTGPGEATFAGATWTAYPFHTIDCTACAADGWYELHTLFSDAAQGDACVGILYLWPSAPDSIELAYLACLPSITSPIPDDQTYFTASWTKT